MIKILQGLIIGAGLSLTFPLQATGYYDDLKELNTQIQQRKHQADPEYLQNPEIESIFTSLQQESNPILKGNATPQERLAIFSLLYELNLANRSFYHHQMRSVSFPLGTSALNQAELLLTIYTAGHILNSPLVTVDYQDFLNQMLTNFLDDPAVKPKIAPAVIKCLQDKPFLMRVIPPEFIKEFYKRTFDYKERKDHYSSCFVKDVNVALALQKINPRLEEGFCKDCDFYKEEIDNNLIKITRSDQPQWQALLLDANKPQVQALRSFLKGYPFEKFTPPAFISPYQIVYINGLLNCSVNPVAFLINPDVHGRFLTLKLPLAEEKDMPPTYGLICYGFEKTSSSCALENWKVIDEALNCRSISYSIRVVESTFAQANKLDALASFFEHIAPKFVFKESSTPHEETHPNESLPLREYISPSQAYALYKLVVNMKDQSEEKILSSLTTYLEEKGLKDDKEAYNFILTNTLAWLKDIEGAIKDWKSFL